MFPDCYSRQLLTVAFNMAETGLRHVIHASSVINVDLKLTSRH
jgi:hypothetical protein